MGAAAVASTSIDVLTVGGENTRTGKTGDSRIRIKLRKGSLTVLKG